MGRKLQIKRGAKAALPALAAGELALTTDEKTMYYGTGAENIPVARAAHSHTAADVGAAPSTHVGDASHVTGTEKQGWNSKAAGNHTHTAAQVGAAAKNHQHIATNISYDNRISGLAAANVQDAIDSINTNRSSSLAVYVESGSFVTATCGTKSLTGTSVDGVCAFIVPINGTWSVSATLNGSTSSTASVMIRGTSAYTCDLAYMFIDVSTKPVASGVNITATLDIGPNSSLKILHGTTDNSGKCIFLTPEPGTWEISVTVDGFPASTNVIVTNRTRSSITISPRKYEYCFYENNDPTFPWRYDAEYSSGSRVAYIAGNSGTAAANVSNIAITVSRPCVIFFDYCLSITGTGDGGDNYALYYRKNTPMTLANKTEALNYRKRNDFQEVQPWTRQGVIFTEEDIVNGTGKLYIAYYRGGTFAYKDNKVAISLPRFVRA